MPKENFECLKIEQLGEIIEDENYLYLPARVIMSGEIKRSYGTLILEPEELKKATPTLEGVYVIQDHVYQVDSVVGQVSRPEYKQDEESIHATLRILKKGNEKLAQLVKDKIIKKLSAGFTRILVEVSEGKYKATNIQFKELSILLDPAIENATILKKSENTEEVNMPDETLKKENELLRQEVEALKNKVQDKDEKIDTLTTQVKVRTKEIENLKSLAEIGKKYEENLRNNAKKFIRVVEGEDSPLVALVDKAGIDELETLNEKYSEKAKKHLEPRARGGDESFANANKDQFNIESASYEEIIKYEQKIINGGE